MSGVRFLLPLLCVLITTPAASTERFISYTKDFSAAGTDSVSLIDTRAASQCTSRSIRGAHCVPAEDFVDSVGRLARFRDIIWAFGASGLNPKRTAIVLGDTPEQRDLVAGLLLLSGHAQVSIVTEPVQALLRNKNVESAPGRARGLVRTTFYEGPARDELVIFENELSAALLGSARPLLLDMRPIANDEPSASEGKLLQPLAGRDAKRQSIVYAGSRARSIMHLTRLHARRGSNTRVFLGERTEWEKIAGSSVPQGPGSQVINDGNTRILGIVFMCCAAALAAAGFVLMRTK